MSSLKPLTMTFTEDDFRVPTNLVRTPVNETTSDVLRISPKPATPSERSLDSESLISSRPPRVSTSERRRQVNQILAEEERLFQQRRHPPQSDDKPVQRRTDRGTSPLYRSSHSSNRPRPRQSPVRYKPSYNRHSDANYFNWTMAGDAKPRIRDEKAAHYHCELCRLGLEHERKERERKQMERAEKMKMDHCETISRFVNEYDEDYH